MQGLNSGPTVSTPVPRLKPGACRLELQWARGRLFDMGAAQVFQRRVASAGSVQVTSVASKETRSARPHGAGLPGLNEYVRSHIDASGVPYGSKHGAASQSSYRT